LEVKKRSRSAGLLTYRRRPGLLGHLGEIKKERVRTSDIDQLDLIFGIIFLAKEI